MRVAPKYDGRLSTAAGRPIGGILPYWLDEVIPQLWIAWHTGFIIPTQFPVAYMIGAHKLDWMLNRKAQWLYHIQNNTGMKPKLSAIGVRLACEMVASMR